MEVFTCLFSQEKTLIFVIKIPLLSQSIGLNCNMHEDIMAISCPFQQTKKMKVSEDLSVSLKSYKGDE